jgi:ribonuclease Z
MADMADEAHKRHHSTTVQAAEIARKAQAGQLVIGHYSSRYKQLEPLLTEAQSVFSPTLLAVEGASYSLSN